MSSIDSEEESVQIEREDPQLKGFDLTEEHLEKMRAVAQKWREADSKGKTAIAAEVYTELHTSNPNSTVDQRRKLRAVSSDSFI